MPVTEGEQIRFVLNLQPLLVALTQAPKISSDRETSILERIRRELGNYFLREVDGPAVQWWYRGLTEGGLSVGTALRHFNVMHHMMTKAATI